MRRVPGRRLAALPILLPLLAALAGTAPARAASGGPTCPAPLTSQGTISPAGGSPFLLCSGSVASFDGTPLDTDVSIPVDATGPRPLMVMLHGWGNSKTDWEWTTLGGNDGNTWHWNNAWFASHGFAVLTYSARGFHRSCGKDSSGYIWTQDGACTAHASWTHLADRRWEVHDAQYLAGVLVDDHVATPQISVTGESYGGGQSWELALSQDQVVDPSSTDPTNPILHPWTSPAGVPLHLRAAVPQFPWTDLAAALVQNGRASDGYHGAPPPGGDANPLGVEKQSYVSGLYADGVASAQYAAPGQDPTADLTSWFAAISAGEPYEQNPETQAALTQVGSAFRSPYAMPVPGPGHRVPVFFLQGHTDPLFPAIQGLQEMNKLLAADPGYPVWGFFGDLGHSYAGNPSSMWHQANTLANDWLAAVEAGSTPSTPRVTVTTTQCVAGQTAQTFSAPAYDAIATTVLHLADSGAAQQTVSAPGTEPEGVQTDPIANSGCRSISAGSDPGVAAYTFPVADPFTLVGSPIVRATVAVNGVNAELAARLWDVDTSGKQTLVSRTVYRITAATPGETQQVAFELFPQAWEVQAGHKLLLELTQNDAPYWRADNEPSSLTLSGVTLDLPVTAADPAAATLPEAPLLPLLPAVSLLALAVPALRRRRRAAAAC